MSAKAMTLRLSPERAAELEAIARAEEMPVSDTVREAIDLLIEKKRTDKEFQARIRTMMDENQRVLERLAQ
jgi:predicted transcriptional regulator